MTPENPKVISWTPYVISAGIEAILPKSWLAININTTGIEGTLLEHVLSQIPLAREKGVNVAILYDYASTEEDVGEVAKALKEAIRDIKVILLSNGNVQDEKYVDLVLDTSISKDDLIEAMRKI